MDDTIDQLRGELAEMRAAIERQQARIAKLEGKGPGAPVRLLRSRRQILKLAGATVAGAAAAAAGIVGAAKPGLALTGDPLVAGGSVDTLDGNIATTATELDYTGAGNVGAAFLAQAGTGFVPSLSAFPAALAGWSELTAMPHGVYGFTNVSGGNGVVAYNGNTTVGGGGPGLYAQSKRGYGGAFAIEATGKSQLFIKPSFAAGAPVPTGHQNGELYVDSAGVLYYFSAGAFTPLAGTAGGITTMLSAPIRLLETRLAYRDNAAVGQTKPGRKLNSGELFDLPITGQVIGGISVPVGAKAVIGNVTVTGTAAGGYLTLYPFGATQPNTSSINYGAGATVANGVIVGLSASGHIAIYVYAQTDVIFDAAGYIM